MEDVWNLELEEDKAGDLKLFKGAAKLVNPLSKNLKDLSFKKKYEFLVRGE
jgi:hypothetical protein